MTADELEALVLRSKDPWDLQKAFAGLDEGQRGKLSSCAQKLMTQLNQNKAGASASPALKAFIAKRGASRWEHLQSRENANAKLAIFAVGPLSSVKKREIFLRHTDRPVMAQIVKDRRPDWIDAFLEHELELEFSSTVDFPLVRSWIKDGVCRKPQVDGYYRMFAAHLMRTREYGARTPAPPISRQLLDDPELLSDIEGMFRVETIAFNTNSWLVKGGGEDFETWPPAIVKLINGGHLDRDRILSLCLTGLTLDVKQNQLAGYHHLYQSLKPTDEELTRHQSRFVDLLAHPVAHVAKFAIDMLTRLEKAGRIDAGAALGEIAEVFGRDSKGNGLAALRLVERLTKGASKAAALSSAGAALRHGNVEVQAKSLEILESNARHLTEPDIRLLAAATDSIAASNRERLTALLGATELAGVPGPPVEPVSSESAPGPTYAPIRVLGDSPVLADGDRIEPITSVDALIDAIFHAVEVMESADELERLIGAMSRLAADRPTDFTRRVDPLLHRLKGAPTSGKGLIGRRFGVGLVVLDLVHTWATGKLYRTPSTPSSYFREQNSFAPLVIHLRELAQRVAKRQPCALLSEPTHAGGWVDPVIWVQRLVARQRDPKLISSMDLALSLARLAPDGRDAALAQARTIASPIGRIARFALGADEALAKADRANAGAWIAAARCRDATADWSQTLAPLGISDQVPGALRSARYQWTSSHEAGGAEGFRWKRGQIEIQVDCAPARDRAANGVVGQVLGSLGRIVQIDWKTLPSAAMSRQTEVHPIWSSDLNATWAAQWLAFVWPQDPSGAHIQAVLKLIWRIDENSSGWEPGFGFFHALFQPGRPWRESGNLLLALGLVAKDADVKGVALDVLIEGVNLRLLDPPVLGDTLNRLCAGGWVKINRLADSLMQAAKVSPLHAILINEALQSCLVGFDYSQVNASALLEVLIETQATAAAPLSPALQSALRGLTGSGKTAKLAKRLL